MKGITLVILALLLATAVGAVVEYGDTYTMQSVFSGTTITNSVRNESPTASLTAWTWSGGAIPGFQAESPFPLPPAEFGVPRPWFIAVCPATVATLAQTTLWWDDGSTRVTTAYVPAVPEPSGLLALGIGLSAGLAILRADRRKRHG